MITALRKRLTKEEKGFTLIELLVVVIILGILTAIAIPSYLSFRDRANDSAAKANVRSIIPSIESYYADHGNYTGMDLTALQASYDQALNQSIYTLSGVTDTTYCISSTSNGKSWKKAGPASGIVQGSC
jgi:prepilin-type N-terminal cleavage/methylation domain-containing protein